MQYGIMKIALKSLEQGLISVFTPLLRNKRSFASFPSHTLILRYALTLEHLGNAS